MADQTIPPQRVQTVEEADRARAFAWQNNSLEDGIGLALSGGGFRAMLFHAGALARLNEWGLLSKVLRVSSVSGGSIAAGILATRWSSFGQPDARGTFANFKAAFVDPVLTFSKEQLDVRDVLTGLLPFTSIAGQVAGSYDKLLFHGKTLQDLPEKPEFVFCATNLETGVLWRFTKAYAGDYVVGQIVKPRFRAADAVAASAAFPPVLSPMELKTSPGDFSNWPSLAGAAPQQADAAPFRQKIVLTDGGVYDNHGLEPIIKRFTTLLVSDGGAPFVRLPEVKTDWLNQLHRVVDLMDNQVRALRRRDLIARYQEGIPQPADAEGADAEPYGRLGAYWGVDTQPRDQLAGMITVPTALINQLASVPTRLTDLGTQTSKQLVNWGYAICDYCVRTHYATLIGANSVPPRLPYPDAPLQ